MNTSVQAKFSHASSHIVLTQDCVFLSIFIVIKTSENLVCPFVDLENERKLHTSFSILKIWYSFHLFYLHILCLLLYLLACLVDLD